MKQQGANGTITETYITKSLNGKVVSSKLLSKDTYNAMQRIILRGTRGTTVTNNNTNNYTNNNSNNNPNNNVNNQPNSSEQKENLVENIIETNQNIENKQLE